jgi:hypothetical protein
MILRSIPGLCSLQLDPGQNVYHYKENAVRIGHLKGVDRMNRKTILFLVPCLLLLGCLLIPAASVRAAQEYLAERFDVDLVVQPDGNLLVSETIQFRFSGDPFTYVFRDLAYTELDAIDQIQAFMDGQPLPSGTDPGQVEIIPGRPTQVTWHFAPTTNSSHTFTLTYRVLGAIRDLETADRLVWRAIPETHEYRIRTSTITLAYPASTSLLASPTLSADNFQLETSENQVAFYVRDINPDTPVDITADFAPGSLVQAPPAWQAAQAERASEIQQAVPIGLVAGGVVLAIGAILLPLLASRLRGDRLPPATQTSLPTSPPGELYPALAAQLTGGQNQALGTIFDLAQRGHLQIEEGPKRRGSRTYELVRLPGGTGALNAHEQGLLQAVFETRRDTQSRVPLSGLGDRLAQNTKQFLGPLEAEMQSRGWLDPQRKSRNARLAVISVLFDLLSAALLIAGFFLPTLRLAAPLIGVGAAGLLLSTVALVYFLSLSPLTEEGERVKAAWQGFAGYLKDVARGRQPALRPDAFELYLPYAASFGLAQQWAKHFEKRDAMPLPAWYHALDHQASFSDVTAVIVASSAASSTAAAGGAAAGAASGGGASGAG